MFFVKQQLKQKQQINYYWVLTLSKNCATMTKLSNFFIWFKLLVSLKNR